jgi:hypothetical protein
MANKVWRRPARLFLLFLVTAVTAATASQSVVSVPAGATNYPPLTSPNPANPAAPALILDPTITRPDPYVTWDPVHHDYVMVTSATLFGSVPTWSSPSMTGPWTWVGDALPKLPSWVTPGSPSVWKPSVADINGTWTLWGSAILGQSYDLCMYRATGPGPRGPFTVDTSPAVSPANFCASSTGGDIDPEAVRARDGTWWLSWKDNGNVTGQATALLSVQLGADGEPTGPVHTLATSNQPWEVGMVESPSFIQDVVTGVWWLTLSGGDFGTPNSYQIAAMPCASLAGPCYDAYTVHLVATNSQGVGPGEQSAFTEPDGAMWILYNPDGPFVDPGLRPLAEVRLGFTTSGLPYIGDPTQPYTPTIPAPVRAVAALSSGTGYWLADAQGYVTAHGTAVNYGGMAFAGLNAPIVGMSATPDGKGYWLVAADGGVFSFGDAGYYGSTGAIVLDQPIVGMSATPDGKGYWLVAADGGVFAYGDARFAGSMGGRPLNAPVVGIAPDQATGGYWLVAADGGVFAFDAPFLGSTGAEVLNAPVNGIIGTTSGRGYMFVAADGGVFNYGDAQFHGSTGGMVLNAPIAGAALDRASGGYWLVGVDGGIFAFDAPFEGAG